MSEPIQRAVAAPAKEWLSESEVLLCLGDISSTTLARYITAGRFPTPVIWSGAARWNWKEVAWYWLGKEIESRLKEQDDTSDPPPAPQPGANHRQKAS